MWGPINWYGSYEVMNVFFLRSVSTLVISRSKTLGRKVNLVVMDLSFISLTKVLPAAFSILKEGGFIIPLIKPQFELSREEVGKGGIVREPELHQKSVDKIRTFHYRRARPRMVWG
jgi:23S rRNA (cytidine1920-2'-O)/16S rRNA (cytidine1409-2'-O)-methyltransferase